MAADPNAIDLSPAERAEVIEILGGIVPEATVHVFGSRATGRARPFSDLDLLIADPPRLGAQRLAELHDRFEASTLPFRVDIVELDALEGVTRQRAIDEGVPLAPARRAATG